MHLGQSFTEAHAARLSQSADMNRQAPGSAI